MIVIIPLLLTFVIAFTATFRGVQPVLAWLLASLVMQVYVLLADFVFPYMGGGASFFPLDLIFGGFYGVLAGGGGAIVAKAYIKIIRRKN